MDDELAFFDFENRQMWVTDRYGALRYHVVNEDKLNSKTLLSLGQRD